MQYLQQAHGLFTRSEQRAWILHSRMQRMQILANARIPKEMLLLPGNEPLSISFHQQNVNGFVSIMFEELQCPDSSINKNSKLQTYLMTCLFRCTYSTLDIYILFTLLGRGMASTLVCCACKGMAEERYHPHSMPSADCVWDLAEQVRNFGPLYRMPN